MSQSVEILKSLLKKQAKMVAMLAPSFPIVYEYPHIINQLKKLGFSYVVEVAAGAKTTNQEVLKALSSDPKARFIASPCPSFVRLVRTKYPKLIPYLALAADSPMIATAKIVKKKYPGYKPVFIGPCLAKKLEAGEDYPELDILTITYKELNDLITEFELADKVYKNTFVDFDISEKSTRLYPTDGGLTDTSGLKKILNQEEIRIVSGWQECSQALEEFQNNTKIRFMDVLFCKGGCINGPGIVSDLSIEERKKKILAFANK